MTKKTEKTVIIDQRATRYPTVQMQTEESFAEALDKGGIVTGTDAVDVARKTFENARTNGRLYTVPESLWESYVMALDALKEIEGFIVDQALPIPVASSTTLEELAREAEAHRAIEAQAAELDEASKAAEDKFMDTFDSTIERQAADGRDDAVQ